MFQGSENIGRMQHVSIINRLGGELNATTTVDRTVFFQRVPSNQLTQVLWLESDRMRSLQINAAKVEKAKQPAKKKARVVRPGSSNSSAKSGSVDIKRASKRLAQTGRVADAAKLLDKLI